MNTPENSMTFERGTLWMRILETTEKALETGALCPIDTQSRVMPSGGVDFQIRVVSSLARKAADKVLQAESAEKKGGKANPFLPYEEDMFVTDVSDTHVCLLNEFNVIVHHLLIVTRAFEHQERLLSKRDFEAICRCMAEFDGLAFYNGGQVAGASQDHKHLQMIPLPMHPSGPSVPMDRLLDKPQKTPGMVSGLPFMHAFKRFSPITEIPNDLASQALYQMYRLMLQQVGLNAYSDKEETLQSGAYNLLFTRNWMLLVPRSREFFESISVNAIGFVGALLARNQKEVKQIEKMGGMAVLKHTAVGI